jgi:hypothetical protein
MRVSTRSPRRTPVVTTETEALVGLADGMTIVIGGFANSGHPMSLIREVIRSGKKGLTIMGAATSSLEVDMLIAAGIVAKVISPYVGGETIVGIGPVFQRAAQRGEIDVWEVDEAMYTTVAVPSVARARGHVVPRGQSRSQGLRRPDPRRAADRRAGDLTRLRAHPRIGGRHVRQRAAHR